MSDDTHWSIVLGAAGGGAAARDAFARSYTPVIRRYLEARWRAAPLRNDIEDATQEVFLECFRQDGALTRAEPDREGGFRAFLFGVVRNVARRFEEKRALRREQAPGSDFDVASDEEPLSQVFDRAWATALLRQAFALQAERARARGEVQVRRVEILRLRYVEGKTLAKIAADWDTTPNRLQYESQEALREFEAALLEVVRRHDPRGATREECARLLQYLR